VSETEYEVRKAARAKATSLKYSTGFGNEHSSEALPGALPVGRNTPQRPPHGLYTELLSGTAFTELRQNTRRTWLYRIRPSTLHPPFQRIDNGTLMAPPFGESSVEPNRRYWAPRPAPASGTDFISGLWTLGGNGDPAHRHGAAVHLYTADTSMTNRVFSNADGEMLIVPQQGSLLIHTELGALSVEPGSIAIVPRAIKFRVEIQAGDNPGASGFARCYVCENFGTPFSLPELGFIGQSGMSNPRDFRAPVAAYEETDEPVEVIHKLAGCLWSSTYNHSPLDVVAWHGTSVPYVYSLRDFQLLGSVTFDHADPSRYTVLTSATPTPGLGNVDFAAVLPEWLAAEDTFRPPYFHRNISSELVGVVEASATVGGYQPGMVALTNMLSAHGPGASAWELGTNADPVQPIKTDGLIVMVETQWPIAVTGQAIATAGETDETRSDMSMLQSHFRRARTACGN
jgi:homogentisate 1,2-dioxygenase